MKRFTLLFFCTCILSLIFNIAQAQNPKTIHGIVQDENGNSIYGASIAEKGVPTNGTTLDKPK